MRSIAFIKLILIIAICNTLISCTDTCNKKFGKTFETLTFEDSEEVVSNQNLSIIFNIGTLSDLPLNYFQESILSSNEIEQYSITKSEISLELKNDVLPLDGNSKDFSFSISFPDRRAYLDCKHPGQSDSYVLDLGFNITKNQEYTIDNIAWNEVHIAGAL